MVCFNSFSSTLTSVFTESFTNALSISNSSKDSSRSNSRSNRGSISDSSGSSNSIHIVPFLPSFLSPPHALLVSTLYYKQFLKHYWYVVLITCAHRICFDLCQHSPQQSHKVQYNTICLNNVSTNSGSSTATASSGSNTPQHALKFLTKFSEFGKNWSLLFIYCGNDLLTACIHTAYLTWHTPQHFLKIAKIPKKNLLPFVWFSIPSNSTELFNLIL